MTDKQRDELIRKAATGEIDRTTAIRSLVTVMKLKDAIAAINAYRETRAASIGRKP